MRDETVPHKMQILITEAKQANILFNLASSTLSYGCLCISCQDMSSLQTSADSILLCLLIRGGRKIRASSL